MADCACIKGYFDFEIIKKSKEHFVYLDASLWMEGSRYEGTKQYTVTVKDLITGIEFTVEAIGHEGVVVERELGDSVFKFGLVNCETPYSKYGVLTSQVDEIRRRLILTDYEKYKDEIIDLMLMKERLLIKVNKFKEEQDEQMLIDEFNELLDFANILKCKL
jgi:hypothetical protein